EPVDERDAVPLSGPHLLVAADHDRAHPFVGEPGEGAANDVRGVVAVDERNRPHRRCAVTSWSIRLVNFSYSSVSRSNWMIRSRPWKGYHLHTATLDPFTSMTLKQGLVFPRRRSVETVPVFTTKRFSRRQA